MKNLLIISLSCLFSSSLFLFFSYLIRKLNPIAINTHFTSLYRHSAQYLHYYWHLIEINFQWNLFNADAGACTSTNIFYYIGAATGGGNTGNFPPPRNRKNCCRKMVLFPKALFLATTFPKLAKNLNFLLNFYQKFSKFSQNFPTICFFVQTREKLTRCFKIYVQHRPK